MDIIDEISKIYESENCLKSLNATKNKKRNMQVHAVFSLFQHENHCSFSCDQKNRILEKTCDCTWFANYQDCPHLRISKDVIKEYEEAEFPLVLTNSKLFELEENIATYERRRALRQLQENANRSNHLLQQLMDRYTAQMKLNLNEVKYEVEPVFSNKHNTWELSFKVGNEKKYVIKSLSAFLKQVDEQKEVTYGKNLTFVHSASTFDDASQETLQFMRKQLQILQQKETNGNDRCIPLIGRCLDEFFALYEDSLYHSFNLAVGSLDLTVESWQEQDYTIFHVDDLTMYHFGERHLYTCENDGKSAMIWKYELDEKGITSMFLQELFYHDVVVSKKDYPKFYKYVLLTAMQYVHVDIAMDDTIEGMDHAELYGDIDEQGRIYFYLYCYTASEKRYHGFDANRVISYEQELIESYIKKYASDIDEQAHKVYMDENQESTLDFIQDGLPYLSEFCDIYASEALKAMGKTQRYKIQVGVKFSNHLLDLDINSLEIPKEELAHVLSAYKRKKKFYRLRNGKLLSLKSDDLKQLDDFMNDYHLSTADLQKKKIQMEPFRMFSLNARAQGDSLIEIERADSFIKQIDAYYEKKEHPIPEHYDAILRDYQKDGFRWLSTLRDYHFNGILADDMGLGKTLQVIALLEANKGGCSLVVCPASLIYNWEEEVHKFTQGLHVICITGPQEERKVRIAQASQYDLLITSYDYLKRDIEAYEAITFDTVILDEAQYIKNQKTKNAICVKQLHATHRLALTGTPIENTLAELWSIFDFLMPEYLFNYHYFQKQYENEIVKNQDEDKQNELRALVSPFILRRNKKDVLDELPDKIEHVRLIEFNDEEKKLYQANLAQVNKELQMMDVGSQKIEILAMLTKLRQLCCEPRTVYENIDTLSSKMSDCLMLLQELNENHQKVLLFSSFTSMLDMLAKELKRKQISYYMLTGSTNKEQRRALVEQFQTDDTCVFLISLKAGGTGLNLTAAEAVIHFDPWWNQSAQNQATDRAYRIGQHKNVQVFKMIMKDSIEEKIMKLQQQKQALADAFVEHHEGSISSMDKEDLMKLFEI